MTTIPNVLTIAGSDSGGGAGIQADLKAFSANGVYGASVLTALTAQNTLGVTAIHDVPVDFITAQIDAVFSDIRIDAVKIGMLSQVDVIDAVAEGLRRHHAGNIILDPVMVATSGDLLLAPDAVDAVRKVLMPMSDLVTPNLHEAAALTGQPLAGTEAEMTAQARALLDAGAAAVLVKGGHFVGDESADLLQTANAAHWYRGERVKTRNTHGTGCSLSSAIAANLARGMALDEAVGKAKQWLTGAIAAADRLDVGQGAGPVHHFHQLWKVGESV